MIIGLGNPGAEYEDTRHNAGFRVIDALAEELGARYWKTMGNARVAETGFKGDRVILVKPQSFMNRSGGPVKAVLRQYGPAVSDLLIVHDELDLPAHTLRLKQGGGHAGHNGLRSIIDAIGPDFARLRIGVGRPPGQMPADRFVLQRMNGDALEEFKVTCAQALPIVLAALEDGVPKAMSIHNAASQGE
jgi:PTH1 family peptidyl-tRNA hydrolase